MKKLTFTMLLGAAIALISCNGSSSRIDLQVPEHVEIKHTTNHLQFPGTRVFIINPEGYTLIPSQVRFQKDGSQFIQALESQKTNFKIQKKEAIKSVQEAQSKGLKSYYQKEFTLGDYDAYLVYGADTKPNLDQMVLAFGDETCTVIMTAELPKNNEKARQETLAALLSCYVDKSAKSDYSALMNYTIDVSNSDFKFNSNMSQIFYYTVDGKGNPVSDFFEDQILIMTLPSMADFEARKEYARSMLHNYEKGGISINNTDEKVIMINGANALETIFTCDYKGKPAKVYQVCVGDNKATLLLCAVTFEKQDKHFSQFKTIAQTLHTK